MSAATEFKEFILRGNVVDLAVGVIIGAAFAGVVSALVADVITPLIGVFVSDPKNPVNFDNLNFALHGSTFLIGKFINAVLSFLLIALVIFFFVVKPVNYLMTRNKTDTPKAATTRDCPECLSSIPLAATRCAFCTAQVPAAAV